MSAAGNGSRRRALPLPPTAACWASSARVYSPRTAATATFALNDAE